MSEEHPAAARMYTEAAEAYLGGPKVEAAGIFRRALDVTGADDVEGEGVPLLLITQLFNWLHGLISPWGRLQGSFLLAVTSDKVHALKWGGEGQSPVEEEIGVFDRDRVWLRSYAGGEVFCFESRRHQIDLDGAAVEANPGAAEVVAALSE
jgi:hypothetical protein